MSAWWPFRGDEILAFSKGMHVDWLLTLDAAGDLSIQSEEYGEALHDSLGYIDSFQQMVRAISSPSGGCPSHTHTNTLQGWNDKINLDMTVFPHRQPGALNLLCNLEQSE